MRNAGEHGLVHMPPVDHCFASLALSPDEALKDNTRCPRPQCRVKDSLSLQEQNIHDPALWPGTAGIVFQCFIWWRTSEAIHWSTGGM